MIVTLYLFLVVVSEVHFFRDCSRGPSVAGDAHERYLLEAHGILQEAPRGEKAGRFLRTADAQCDNAPNPVLLRSQVVLLGIVWNAFCNAFAGGLGLELRHGVALLAVLPALHIGSLLALLSVFRSGPSDASPGAAVAATFCGAHKTLAFGLPLINTVFEGNPNLASYCAPIMIMHPLQLAIGSLVVPYFKKITEEEKRNCDA